jgi:nicotinamide-nucleotide amidase
MKNQLDDLAIELGQALAVTGLSLVTAESCTGGLVATRVTDVAGCSDWFDRAFITYTNLAKQEMLGVSEACIDEHGAVSEETVRQMATGALAASRAQVAIAISGVAGPSGGSEDKPVGTVWFAWAYGDDSLVSERQLFGGDRKNIRQQAAAYAMRRVIERLRL